MHDIDNNTYLLEKLHSINDLGVIFDSCLSFRGHISHKINKAYSTLTGAVPAMKPEATAIFAPQDGRWKITVSFDGRRFCVPKFRH